MLQNELLFSIIVPIYGVEYYLPKCVDSLLCQSYTNIEIILVDDGSEDKCAEMCDQYANIDKRIIVVHKSNGGLVSARQAGVAVSKGEFVVCVDGDDWVDNDYIETFAAAAKTYNPDVIVCGSKYSWDEKEIIKPCNLSAGYYNRTKMETDIFPALIHTRNGKNGFQGQLWAKAFRREIYQKQQLLVDVVVNMGEDRACTIPTVFNSQSIYVCESNGYHYRQIGTSMTKTKKPLRKDGPEIIHRHLCNALDMNQYGLMEQMYRATCHSLFNVCKTQFYGKEGYWKTCRRIKNILETPIYKESIRKARFKGSITLYLMLFSLRHQIIFLMYLYSKI